MRYKNILDNVLGQKAKIKLLRTMLRTRTEASGRQIARDAGVSHWQAHKALQDLSVDGIIKINPSGKNYLYSVNEENYIVSDILEPIFSGEKNVLKNIATEVATLAPSGAILSITLFGSTAKGTEKPKSDIDLAVIVKNRSLAKVTENAIDDKSLDLMVKYGVRISCYVTSIQEYIKRLDAKEALERDIINQGKTLFGNSIMEVIANER